MQGLRAITGVGLCTAALVACAPAPRDSPPPASSPVPAARPQPADPAPAADPIARHYAQLERRRRAQGLMRTDPAPGAAPITAARLARAFEAVALREEYTINDDSIVQRERPAPLRRWQEPVRIGLDFADAVPFARRDRDLAVVGDYVTRLARLTGHDIALAAGDAANFHVLVLDEESRRAIGPRLTRLVPGIDTPTRRLMRDLPLSVSCLVATFTRGDAPGYSDAVAVIRAELPDRSRDACYYEELAQGLGLSNDSPEARPSIFNDNAEFAAPTALDEQMLRMLYNPRLRPGMSGAEARPIIRMLASELRDPPS